MNYEVMVIQIVDGTTIVINGKASSLQVLANLDEIIRTIHP